MPNYIITPSEVEERRLQEEQAAKEARSKELAKARYEKCKQDKRLAHNREWQKEWREKRNSLYHNADGGGIHLIIIYIIN